MSVPGPCYTGETPIQISARETFNAQTQAEVGLRNHLAAAIGNSAVPTLVSTLLTAYEAKSYTIEISPSTVVDSSGNVSNKHK
jgi:hypothetical protein